MKHKAVRTLKDYREENGLSQHAAGQQVGVSQASWMRWERGIDRPRREHVKRLLAVTGVSLEVLIGIAS